jgi:Na+-driven multidrug efflux pump
MPSDRQKLFLEGPIGSALIRLAIPITLGNLLQTGYQLTDAFWVGRLGAAAVAAVSISFPVTFLVIALGAGLGIAGATLSAQYMGAGRQDLVNHVAAQTMMMVTVTSAVLGAAGYAVAPSRVTVLGAISSFAILSVVGLIAYVFAPALVAFFVPGSAEVIAEGGQFIRIMCLAWGGIGVQLCIVAAFRASGNMLASMVIALVSQFMLQFPLAYILSRHTTLQATGLWWSFPITTVLVALVSVGWFAQGGWKRTVLTEEDRQVVKVAEETIAEEGIR